MTNFSLLNFEGQLKRLIIDSLDSLELLVNAIEVKIKERKLNLTELYMHDI